MMHCISRRVQSAIMILANLRVMQRKWSKEFFNMLLCQRRIFDIFLSWLDKIRVGLWLGFLYLSKNPFNISPSFYIAKRLSTNDRAVIIYRAHDQRPGLAFHATNVPMFHHMPSCFTLVINDFYFFNVSAEFLFARRLGFPVLLKFALSAWWKTPGKYSGWSRKNDAPANKIAVFWGRN